MEASNLLSPTPGAPLPASDQVSEIAAFADRQTGQLDKANADKSAARHLLQSCEEFEAKALENALQRAKPWWKRIF